LLAGGSGNITTNGALTMPNQSAIKLIKNEVQVIAQWSTGDIFTWDASDLLQGFSPPTAGTSRITITNPGTYVVGYETTTNINDTTGYMTYILLNTSSNGTTVRRYAQSHGMYSSNNSTILQLVATDYLQVGVRNLSAAGNFPENTNADRQMEFWCYKLG
jgi:hypothetical protein